MSTLHPKYNPNADAAGEGSRITRIGRPNSRSTAWTRGTTARCSPRSPTLDPWHTVKNTPTLQNYERNPFYWAVDSEGNQLPYIDKWAVELAQYLEIFNTRAMSGNLSVAGLNLLLVNYPLLKDSAQKSNYTIQLVYTEMGADVALAFNQIHPDPVMTRIFNDVRFRQAMSMAINRKNINELVFLGQAVPRQATMHDSVSFFKKEWADGYATV